MLKTRIVSQGSIVRLTLFLLLFAVLIAPLLMVGDQLIQLFFGTCILLGLMVLWARYVERADERLYGLLFDQVALWDFVVGLVVGVVAVAVMLGLAMALGLVQKSEVTGIFLDTALALLLAKVLLVSIWEEAFFRGLLPAHIAKQFGGSSRPRIALVSAVLISSLLFAAAHAFTEHFKWSAFAILALNGAVWCVPVLLTERLGLCIGLHVAWNFAQLKIFGFAMSGNAPDGAWMTTELADDPIWSGGRYGPEAGLLGIVGVATMLALTVAYCRLTGRDQIKSVFGADNIA